MCPFKFMCNIITQVPALDLPNNVAAPLRWKPYLKLLLPITLLVTFSLVPRTTSHLTGLPWSCQFSSVQLLSCVRLFAIPWIAAHQASLSITNSQSLPRPMSIELVIPSNHLILCCPLLLLPSIFPSIRVFSKESVLCIRWPKYWSFSFSISPSNEYSGLISCRIDWSDLFAVQETLQSLLQHHSLKASVLRCSTFFKIQLSHPYMTTGKTTALTVQKNSPWAEAPGMKGVGSLPLHKSLISDIGLFCFASIPETLTS